VDPTCEGERDWCRGLRLPDYVLDTPGVAAAHSTPAAPRGSTSQGEGQSEGGGRSPVLPTLFMPGFPKSATTWLYNCFLDAFAPRRAGCGADASGWGVRRCNRTFLLPPLTAAAIVRRELQLHPLKETFYFGGSRQRRFRRDLRTLAGPDLARGALPGEPPLWAWEPRFLRLRRAVRAARRRGCGPAAAACEARREARGEQGGESDRVLLHRDLTERLSSVCAGGHPACTRVVRGGPTSNGCYGEEAGAVLARLGRGDLYCVHSALPRAAAGEYPMLVSDFTPNYLCDPEALPRLKASAADPSALRFIVAMREPAARAFSEWAMFALQWTWEPIADFGPAFASKAAQLRDCNESLWRDTELLRSLPTEELAAYLSRCWVSGGALNYPHTSLYGVCVLHALRHFERRQFLFLRYEDLMQMDAAALLRLIGRFTGLPVRGDLFTAVPKKAEEEKAVSRLVRGRRPRPRREPERTLLGERRKGRPPPRAEHVQHHQRRGAGPVQPLARRNEGRRRCIRRPLRAVQRAAGQSRGLLVGMIARFLQMQQN